MRLQQKAIALLAVLTLMAGLLHAQVDSLPAPPAGSKIPDVRVIIDISGSMKQNDPNNLRRPALELLVKLFPEGSKAGVWTFGQWVNMLVSHKPVNEQWRQSALSKAKKINSVALHTNIPEVLIKATDDIDRLSPDYQTSLILLTDGMVDVSKSPAENAKARQQIIDEIIPRLREAGISVHTVALSSNADRDLMQYLAVQTDGLAAVAQTADDLRRIFLQAFDAAAPAEQLPLEGNSFLVDSSIEEFTALIFRQPDSEEAVLVAPDGSKYTQSGRHEDVKWFHQSDYDLITVKRPFEGQWSVIADLQPDSRVTIVSNLSLVVSALAANTFIGSDSSLSAVLKQQGEIITQPELLDIVEMSLEVNRRDDNQQWQLSLSGVDSSPANGVFRSALTMLQDSGVYDITVRANGKTFQRQHKQTIEVRDNFSVTVKSTDENPPNHSLTLLAVNPIVDVDTVSVTANITRPDSSTESLVLTEKSARGWLLSIDGIEQSGLYQVNFNIEGRYLDGEPLLQAPILTAIEHHVIGSQFVVPTKADPQPEPAVEPEPELEETAQQPAAELQSQDEPPVEDELPAEDELPLSSLLLYIGIAVGNLLLLVLGYFVYKMVSAPTRSAALEDDDEDDMDEDLEDESVDDTADADIAMEAEPVAEPEPEPEPLPDEDLDTQLIDELDEDQGDEVDLDLEDSASEPEEPAAEDDDDLSDLLDLPDDAIDIDPGVDEEDK